MTEATKDTIYIDIDDEITGVIDKVRSSKHKIVALVLPKRATVFQSIVNMKLLKRTADSTKKRVVLITSEATILPLAGAVGLHVAKTLQSKPHVPEPPDVNNAHTALDDQEAEEDPEIDSSRSIGELAGAGAGVAKASKSREETIELDDVGDEVPVKTGRAAKKAKKANDKKNKKIAIPDFNRFRKRLMLGIGAFILLIILFILANVVLPKAKITIKTDTQSVNSNVAVTLNTATKEVDEEKAIIPAVSKEVKKTETEKVATTGQKDVGTKASGTVTLKNCYNTDGGVGVAAGTTLTTNGMNYVTNEAITLPASTFSGGGSCTTATREVGVTAQNAGDKYNLSGGRTWGVSGTGGKVTGVDSSAMTGGTSKVIKVVTAQDIESGKQKIIDKTKTPVSEEMKKAFEQDDLFGVTETINAGTPQVTSSPRADDEASEVTVTAVITYKMLGAKKADLDKVLENDAKKQIDTSKQAITNTGLDDAVITVNERKNDNEQKLSIQSTVVAGVQIDQDALKKEIAGRKSGEVRDMIQSRPNVKEVDVKYSPFWVSKSPKKASKIVITIESINDNDSDNN